MPQRFENTITNLDDIPKIECQHIPLNCLLTIASHDTSLTVIITCLKWTFNYDFCVRVTAYPLGLTNVTKQIDLDDHHPLHRYLTDALNLYEAFPEPHLNSHQLEVLEELIGDLHFKFSKIRCHKNLRTVRQIGMILKRNVPCPWTITSEDETLAVIITCLKWTFNYDFWIRVTAHPEKNPIISKQIDIDRHHPLLESLSEALNDYVDFPKPHLNSHQIHISWKSFRNLFLRRYNPQNGQCSSSLSRLGTGQIFWHKPIPGCRSIHPLNRVQN